MDTNNDGGPAFPCPQDNINQNRPSLGMTLRDYFAAKALPGVYSEFWRTTGHFPPDWEVGLAHDAYRMADAMLKVRTAT